MKPVTLIVACGACCLAAAGSTHLMHRARSGAEPAAASGAASAASAVRAVEARVGDLEREVDALRREVALARAGALASGRAADRPTAGPRAAAGAPGDDGGDPAAGAPATVAALDQRLAEIEKGEVAARALRQRAVLALRGEDGRGRRDAARLLGSLARSGDEAAKQELLAALASESPSVREDALEGIAESGLADFVPALEQAIADPEAEVRGEVADALRRMPAEQAGPLLARMLGDADPGVLREAIEGLGDLRYQPAVRDLAGFAGHPDERVAIEASIALVRLGDPSAAERWVERLGGRLASDDPSAREDAVRALRRMELESARPYLEQALHDPSGDVRRQAERALRALDGGSGGGRR